MEIPSELNAKAFEPIKNSSVHRHQFQAFKSRQTVRKKLMKKQEKKVSRDLVHGTLPCGRETLRRRRAPGRPRPGRWAGGRTPPSPGTARPQT
jgi:hypothetical protein